MSKRTIAAPVAKPLIVSNDRKGVTLHLGDGRKLAYGESAEVSSEVAAQIEALRG